MKENKLFAFKITLVLLIAGAYLGLFALKGYNSNAFWWIFVVVTVLSILMVIQSIIAQNNIHKFIAQMDMEINSMERESLFNFPAPTIIVDAEDTIIWYNKGFTDTIYCSDSDPFGVKLSDIIELDHERLYTADGAEVSYRDRCYKIRATRMDKEDSSLSMIYFEDITEYSQLAQRLHDSRVSVVLIMIDNYDDLLQNVKESDKAHILVQIEKLLENFIDKTSGLVKKLSNDRFVALLEEKDIERIMEEKFRILDRARAITVGDRLCVTLSIGVGRGGKTLAESEAFAKQALDMSLGRGGDQASVKTESGYEFFGGVAKGIEKHAKVKTRIIATALREMIESSSNVIIMGHRFGDLDSLGSAVGLAGAVRNMNILVNIAVNFDKNLAASLIDRINETVGEGLFLTPEKILEEGEDALMTKDTLLIIVDTHNRQMVESTEIYEKAERVVVIDHHRKMVNFIEDAVLFHHEPYASSASEMVSELIQYFDDAGKIDSYYAEALLSGIMLDTRNFVMRTGVRTFEAAAFLKKMGADTVAVRGLFTNSIESYQSKTRIISSAEVYRRCAIASSDDQSENIRISAPQAADEMLGISGVDASFVLYEMNGAVNFSARSLGAMNVQLIMEKLGGGGHQTMAGAQLEGISMEDARQRLLVAIDEYLLATS